MWKKRFWWCKKSNVCLLYKHRQTCWRTQQENRISAMTEYSQDVGWKPEQRIHLTAAMTMRIIIYLVALLMLTTNTWSNVYVTTLLLYEVLGSSVFIAHESCCWQVTAGCWLPSPVWQWTRSCCTEWFPRIRASLRTTPASSISRFLNEYLAINSWTFHVLKKVVKWQKKKSTMSNSSF